MEPISTSTFTRMHSSATLDASGAARLPAEHTPWLDCRYGARPPGTVHRSRRRMVPEHLRRADSGPGEGLAGHLVGRPHADPGTDRVGQDPGRLPVGARPAVRRRRARAHPRPLRLPAARAEPRRRAQPARAAGRHRRRSAGGGRAAKRRHAAVPARGDPPQPAGHPDHHARVAVPDADLRRPRGAELGRDGDHRRDPRRRRHQARLAPDALAGAAVGDHGDRAAADRAVGDAAPAGGDLPLPGRRPAGDDRRRRPPQAARPGGGDPGRGHARAGRRADGRGRAAAVDLAGDLPAAAGAGAGAPLDDRVRQQPPLGRARRQPAERARRGAGRPLAPRLDRPRAAARGRGAAEVGAAAGAGRDVVARARHRHGRRRPGRPDRVAQVGGRRPAARRPRRPRRRRGVGRPLLPEVAGRPAGDGRGRPPDARGRDRAHAGAQAAAGRAGAAGGGGAGDGRVAGRRAPRLWCAGRIPTASCRAPSSRACWRCWPAATRRTSSPSCGRGSSGTGSPARCAPATAPAAWPSSPEAPSPTAACTACSWPTPAPGSASWTRRWCTRPGRARCSSWARPRGGSSRSPATACWSRPRPACPARCRSGRATASAARSSWASPSARPCASGASATWTSWPPATWPRTWTTSARRPASCRTTGRSSSSGSATRSATGGSASSRRSAAACTRPGRWPSRRGWAPPPASRWRRCGRTTASPCGCPTPTSRRRWS